MGDEYAYDDSYSKIDFIDFDVLSNEEIKRMSSLDGGGVEIPDLFENNEPKKSGMIDPRMGTCTMDINCASCGFNTNHCVGHFGHIDLAEPLFHIGYFPFVHMILSCICIRCSELLVYRNEAQIIELLKTKSGKERLTYFRQLSKNITHCSGPRGCGAPVPKIKMEKKKTSATINIIAETEIEGKEEGEVKQKLRHQLTADIIYDILKNIKDDNCRILGIEPKRSRPENMIHKTFPVPPVQVRPSVKGDFNGGASAEDDLTKKLADIVKANLRIKRNKENQTENVSKYSIEHTHLLQYHVGTYIESDAMGLLKAEVKGKQFKSIGARLKGKFGRVRQNLMGKRGDFTARTVITPDPAISNNQLGVPIKIAMTLTFPETVTPANIEFLSKLVRNGRNVYPGANFVFQSSQASYGRRVYPIDLRFRKDIDLAYGDVVERHLLDGDIVLLNRQPTLHKQSMMGHRIKVINDPALMTFRLSLCVTISYNADFDGDEMNIFVPQSLQTQIELEEIAAVERQIISPTTSKTLIGIVQDGLIGAYNLTTPNLKIDWRTAMNLMTCCLTITVGKTEDDYILGDITIKKGSDYTGQELYSLLLPSEINISKEKITIKNGKIEKGQLSKDLLGAKKKNNLIQLMWDGFGVEKTRIFLDNTQRLMNNFNLWHGFSVGLSDTIVPNIVHEEIDKMFETTRLKLEHFITETENNPEYMTVELYEQKLYSELDIIRNNATKLVMENLKEDNGFKIMEACGSKGDPTNIGQMIGCLGLQLFEGKIQQKKYNNRTLAYFHQNEDSLESRGLVRESLVNGLEFPSFVYLLTAGRLGLIEAAIKSVSYDTDIIIQVNGEIKQVLIGEWIDQLMEENKKSIKREKQYDMELLELKDKTYIPTCDEHGKTSWERLTVITRHDPTEEMYEIETYCGREATVANSKSLLIWDEKKKIFEAKLTSEVKVGDYVPVSHTLCKPRVIKDYIDMTKYFPKEEYLYGTEYHLADKITREKLAGGRKKIPGYWDEYNGNEFTVPFKRMSDLMRSTSGRSKTNHIEDDYVYPFSKSRDHGLPDKFPLNRENGVFIGLFLADGNANDQSGHVQITKDDPSVQKFVCDWFDKFGFKWKKYVVNKVSGVNKDVKGKIESIQGYSMMLARFMKQLVGHMAYNKFVPNEAFSAPKEFVIGLLDGYFSGDGCVSKYSINCGSTSKKLIQGISILCARFGIFGRMTKTQQKENNLGTEDIKSMYNLDIRSIWATRFREIIKLTHKEKNKKLQDMSCSNNPRNIDITHDVVLDKITVIRKVDISKHKKLYDVTVPKTLNFLGKSGLAYADTSETGYIQRKLVKSMEDIMVKYDGTVRTANDNMIQFIYGDSGTDTTKQYEHQIKLLDMSNDEVKNTFMFNKDELSKHEFEDNENLYNQVIELRDLVRTSVRRAKMDYIKKISNFMLPVNLNRIISSEANSKSDSKGKLEAKYIISQLEELLSNEKTPIVYMSKETKQNKNSVKNKDEQIHKTVFRTAVYDSLHPKRVLFELKLIKKQFDNIIEQISYSFNKNMAEPGEMTGVIAAQSIGEPLSQMTLKSFHHAGIASMSAKVQGVPRMKELLSVSKKPKSPQMEIYLTEEFADNKEMVHRIASYIRHTTFEDIRKRINFYYDPYPTEKDSIMDSDNVKQTFYQQKNIKGCSTEIKGLPWLLRIEIDREKMMEKGITLLEIKSKFCNWWERRLSDLKQATNEEKKVLNKITQIAVLSNTDNDKQPVVHIRFNVKESDKEKDKFGTSTVNDFIDYVIDKFKLKGLESITDVPGTEEKKMFVVNKETGALDKQTQHIIYATGVNMIDIRYINGIDLTRTITNNIIDIYDTFGIEIARAVLLKEISDAYEKAGGEINYQHVELISDLMTCTGRINSIDRHGMNKSDNDPLSRASFEKTVEQLLIASVYGETDHMKGVSARIMAGQVIKGGTGFCELELNTEMIEKSEYIEDTDFTRKYTEIQKNTLAKDIIERKDDNVFVPMENDED